MARRMSGAMPGISGRRPSTVDDLNDILHSVISGDQTGDLQYVDDGEEETIIITTKTGRRLSLTTRRNSQLPKLVIPKISYDESDASSLSSTSTEATEYMENPGPLLDYPPPMRGLKRNSISMPTLNVDDLERLQALYRSAEGPSATDSEEDEEDEHNHSHHKKVSLFIYSKIIVI